MFLSSIKVISFSLFQVYLVTMILESMRKLGLETWLHLVGAFSLSQKSESELFVFHYPAHFKESRKWKCFFVILNMQERESEFVAFTIELIVDVKVKVLVCYLVHHKSARNWKWNAFSYYLAHFNVKMQASESTFLFIWLEIVPFTFWLISLQRSEKVKVMLLYQLIFPQLLQPVNNLIRLNPLQFVRKWKRNAFFPYLVHCKDVRKWKCDFNDVTRPGDLPPVPSPTQCHRHDGQHLPHGHFKVMVMIIFIIDIKTMMMTRTMTTDLSNIF